VCAVVAAHHRIWWKQQIDHLIDENVIEQSTNRGTALGVLLPLINIVARDPEARIVVLPADHYVRDEGIFADALRRAAACAALRSDAVYLLGVRPDEADSELGYIVPAGTQSGGPSLVERFVEKPPIDQARVLIERGALWNVFVIAGAARALLGLYGKHFVATIARLRRAVEQSSRIFRSDTAIGELYHRLPSADFSRDVLQGQEARLRVLAVPRCGWADLGTPQRVAQTLQCLPEPVGLGSGSYAALDLAAQYRRGAVAQLRSEW
jgi:mannose-1-phosphate guanylyltransferase